MASLPVLISDHEEVIASARQSTMKRRCTGEEIEDRCSEKEDKNISTQGGDCETSTGSNRMNVDNVVADEHNITENEATSSLKDENGKNVGNMATASVLGNEDVQNSNDDTSEEDPFAGSDSNDDPDYTIEHSTSDSSESEDSEPKKKGQGTMHRAL
ncbi:hypothetical protein CBL_08412 [Carabus blaptoides fortunei]